jgi:hypothetical protein
MKIQVFWNVAPYILVTSYRRFGGVCSLHLYRVVLKPEGSGSQKIYNEHPEIEAARYFETSAPVSIYMTSYPRAEGLELLSAETNLKNDVNTHNTL